MVALHKRLKVLLGYYLTVKIIKINYRTIIVPIHKMKKMMLV